MKTIILTVLMLAFTTLAFGQTELLTNGDFEDGRTPWTDTAGEIRTEGENSYFFANVETAVQAFEVNLSQAGLEITQDSVYTLTFNASTGAGNSRTMIVGIGLNEDPFTAATETITLTEGDSTYTVVLQANFGSNDARVLFDMGAEVGIVVLDNVSLVQDGEIPEEPSATVPETAAPMPPTRNADDVISLFSDAYTNIDVTTFETEWSQGSSEGNVEIADGDSVKLYDIGNFIGIQLANSIDLSSFTHMHFDYWVADESVEAGAVFNPKLSNHGNLPDAEGETSAIGTSNPVSTVGEWVSFDVALEEFTAEAANGILDRDKIYQIVMTTSGTINSIYIDNLYFYKGTTTSVDNVDELPNEFALQQNYPNPFNPTTNIAYQIPNVADVTLKVYDITGREVAAFNEGRQSAGSYSVSFDASNLSSGIYIYRIEAGAFSATRKMTLIK